MSWLDINAQIQIGSCDSYGNPAQVRGVPFENWNENAANTYEYFPDQEIFTSLFTFELEWRQQKALHRILKKKKSPRSSKSVLIRRVCRKDLCHVWQHHKKGANIFCSEQVSGAALHFGDFFFGGRREPSETMYFRISPIFQSDVLQQLLRSQLIELMISPNTLTYLVVLLCMIMYETTCTRL